MSVPKIAPSKDFFGLMFGVILCFPIFLPTRKAKMSVAHEQENASMTRNVPSW